MMFEVFAVKAKHSVVLVPIHKKRPVITAYTFVMNNPRIRDEENPPVFELEAHAPVQIFAVQEILFVP